MRFQPVARRALRVADLAVAHLLGDLTAQPRTVLVAAHGGDVEPLVRLHEIDADIGADGVAHAERKAVAGVFRFIDGRGRRDDHVGHWWLPFRLNGRPSPSIASLFVRSGMLRSASRSWGENLNDSLSDAMNRR